MRLSRDELLYSLERVTPALSPGETFEQATSFCFKDRFVHAYNRKLYCGAPLPAGLELEGAVYSKRLLAVLRKLTADVIDVKAEDDKLTVRTFGRGSKGDKLKDRGVFVMDSKITLPLQDVDEPKVWKPLNESFSDALAIVQEAAGKDREMYYTVCVHVHPEWLEAIASVAGPACRYRFEDGTGVDKPCLVERDIIKAVVASGVEEIGETDGWLHFRSGEYRMSCRRELDNFPDLSDLFGRKGFKKVILPASLNEAAEICEYFSSEEKDRNLLSVDIRPGAMRVHGEGLTGNATGFRDCDYDGPPVSFYLSPALLKNLVEKGGVAWIGDKRLMVDGGKWRSVVALSAAPEKETR